MNRDKPRVNEHDLHAYADGMLDGSAHAAVEAYLADNRAAADEVESWKRQNDTLRALYRQVAPQPMPSRFDVHRIERESRAETGRWGRMAAAAVLLLAVGTAAGWYGHGMLTPPRPVETALVDEAMMAHKIYSGEVIHPVEVRAGEKDHLQAWLSKRLARSLTVPDLRSDGLALVGGRLLPSAKGPAAQFMYEDETGRRVTLYIIPARAGRETSFRYASLDPLEAFFWTDETISCALVGDLPRERLQEIAFRAYKQLE